MKGSTWCWTGSKRCRAAAPQTITLEHLGYSTEAQNRRIAQHGPDGLGAAQLHPRAGRCLCQPPALGPDRAATINRLGSLERKGVPLGLHSDFNMAPIDPLYLAWVAANRITIGGNVKAPDERLEPRQGVAGDHHRSRAGDRHGRTWSVRSQRARRPTFAVLDRDPYSLGASRLRDLKVLGVIYEGQFTASPG